MRYAQEGELPSFLRSSRDHKTSCLRRASGDHVLFLLWLLDRWGFWRPDDIWVTYVPHKWGKLLLNILE